MSASLSCTCRANEFVLQELTTLALRREADAGPTAAFVLHRAVRAVASLAIPIQETNVRALPGIGPRTGGIIEQILQEREQSRPTGRRVSTNAIVGISQVRERSSDGVSTTSTRSISLSSVDAAPGDGIAFTRHRGNLPADSVSAAPSSKRRRIARGDATTTSGASAAPTVSLSSRTWQLYLAIDSREVFSRTNRSFVESKLLQAGVPCEVRQLPLGDMLWLLRSTDSSGPPLELLTDFIVERKEAGDLAASIVDGRYEEQKLRLRKAPCRRVLYVVEGNLSKQDRLSPTALQTSLCTTHVISGFSVHKTTSLDATIELLARWHFSLERLLFHPSGPGEPGRVGGKLRPAAPERLLPHSCHEDRSRPIQWVQYRDFYESAKKTGPQTALEIFGAQLRQVQGLSAPRAEAVLSRYPTPSALRAQLAAVEPTEARRLLEDLPVPGTGRRLGPSIAKLLWKLYGPASSV